MRQGQASRNVRESTKVEPKANAINPRAVGQIGTTLGNHITERGETMSPDKVAERMHKGRGFQAPHDAGRTIHQGGSQRRS